MQWKAYLPGVVGAVNVAVAPAGTVTSKELPSSAVTLWASSMFVTETVAPGLTETGVRYSKSSMLISAATTGADDEAPAEDDSALVVGAAEADSLDVVAEPPVSADDPQAEATRTSAHTAGYTSVRRATAPLRRRSSIVGGLSVLTSDPFRTPRRLAPCSS